MIVTVATFLIKLHDLFFNLNFLILKFSKILKLLALNLLFNKLDITPKFGVTGTYRYPVKK